MTLEWQPLILGTGANTGTGDDLRTAFSKVDNNLTMLHEETIITVESVGDGESVVAEQVSRQVSLKSIKVDNNLAITSDATTITISSTVNPIEAIQDDQSPQLSADLNVNGHAIFNSEGDLHLNDLIITNLGDDETIIKTEKPVLRLISVDGQLVIGMDILATGSISCDTVYANTEGTHTGRVIGNVVGNITGNSTGLHTGNVDGNVSGTAGDISNHQLNELSDVADTNATSNDILQYDGNAYTPISINDAVSATGLAFRIPSFDLFQRNLLIAANGDVIYNTEVNKFQGYADGIWVDLH
jgi:hypothetical protein